MLFDATGWEDQRPERPAAQPKELKIRIDRGPCCPHCGMTGFDDWWHDKTTRRVVGAILARLRCHGCGRFFSVQHFEDGITHSTAWKRRRA